MALSHEEPDRFLGHTGGRILFAIVGDCAQGDRMGHMLDAISNWIKKSAAVIIPKAFGRTTRGKRLDHVQHFLQNIIELFGNVYTALAREMSRMQKKIERVYVIVERLFEIDSVGADLPFRFFQYDFPTLVLPALRRSNLRA